MGIRLSLFIALLLNVAHAYSQDTTHVKSRKAYFVEGGGPAILPSLNFDTRFRGSGGWGITASAGIFPDEPGVMFSIASNINYLFGKRVHFTEIGFGAGYGSNHTSLLGEDFSDGFLYGQCNLGYRMQPARGFFLRMGASFTFGSGGELLPYLGLGLAR